ncbi:MAG TPA: glycoside hydrolase family 2 protein [Ktedonobacteraceae bacterium]
MFDRWKLQDFTPGEGYSRQVFAEQVDTREWIDITAPGDVHQALIEAGRIEDPFYDRNEDKCAWIPEREWWYRITFASAEQPLHQDERFLLVFQGLDTFATIWLNGTELGKTANMFREAVFDISQYLRTDAPNTLALCFHPPLQQEEKAPFENWGRNPERVTMRKAQFGYGWDWGPRLPTIGIWRPVELRRQRYATIQGMHFSTLAIDEHRKKALVAVQLELERFGGDQALKLNITLLSPETMVVAEQTLTLQGNSSQLSATVYMEVENPQLWWTHDLGEPALYTLRATLSLNGTQLEQQQQQVGIRTLELDQSPDTDEPGTRFFRFVLNGVPIFVRGACWIPAHSFVGALKAERYEMLLKAAQEANMNMLRVWGGGIYEHDVFYELCNRSGILVWQDFMFACAMYPEDKREFVDEVEAEARYQVRRLRNHPCLALWCGNNENQWIHDRTYWDKPDFAVPGSLYYNKLLPQIVKELDGKTPYWPGSPYGGNDYNSMDDGDLHNWQVWHGNVPRQFGEKADVDRSPAGVSFLHYAEDMGRFISEFGMHASPVYETLRRTIPTDQLYYHSPSMDHHNKDNPKNKGDNLMATVTGLPTTLEEYIDYSMLAQAEGLKFGIEHYRRRKPHCSGTLIWQLNDCWPVLSWSIVDYYGFGKAGYFYTRRAYAAVMASFQKGNDGSVELWITNDTLSEVTDTLTIRFGTFANGTTWEEKSQIRVMANGNQVVWHGDAGKMAAGTDSYLSVHSTKSLFPANRHFFSPLKEQRRTPVQPEITITSSGEHELHVHLHAVTYTYFLHLLVADERTHFTDNYFDLEAGERRTIILTNQSIPLTPDMVSVGWR